MNHYTAEPVPGEWEHRSGDCEFHGLNIAVARPKGHRGLYKCVKCMLIAAATLAFEEKPK